MAIWSLTAERAKKLQEQLNEKEKELEKLLSTSAEEFWEADLEELIQAWDVMSIFFIFYIFFVSFQLNFN